MNELNPEILQALKQLKKYAKPQKMTVKLNLRKPNNNGYACGYLEKGRAKK